MVAIKLYMYIRIYIFRKDIWLIYNNFMLEILLNVLIIIQTLTKIKALAHISLLFIQFSLA